MATLKIEPIETKTRSNQKVIIDGINPASNLCLRGKFWIGNDGSYIGNWDIFGRISNRDETLNIDMDEGQLPELIELLKLLGAK